MVQQPFLEQLAVTGYRFVEELGRGSTGITYSAESLSTGEKVAIKVVSIQDLEDWKSLQLLEREAAILAKLDHPAIPKYINYFQQETDNDRCFCIVQQFASGKSLAKLVEEGWRTSEKEVKNIARQVLEILSYLHQLDPVVIHRDIKPENLILSETGQIYLVDFGAVRETYQNALTRGSTVVGTYGYMAPEQFRGCAVPATDLYGLGATLLYLLTHRSPSELPHDTLRINFRARIKLSEPFAAWLEQMLDPDLDKRFSCAREALAGLKQMKVVKARSWLKLGGMVAGVAAIAVFGYQYRWFWMSRLGYYPTGCDVEQLETYFRQGGSAKTLMRQPQSSLWCLMRRSSARQDDHPIYWVSREGHHDLLKTLLAAGADPNMSDQEGWTPLMFASREGHLEIVERLLAAGADPTISHKNNWTLLMSASQGGHREVVEKLLAAGADPTVSDPQGWTALHLASGGGDSNIVKALLAAGADPNVSNSRGWTPLHIASRKGHLSIVEQLLAAGADPNSADVWGHTPLHRASFHDRGEIAEKLLAAGANPNVKNDEGNTPLYWASFYGHQQIVEKLLAAGADPP